MPLARLCVVPLSLRSRLHSRFLLKSNIHRRFTSSCFRGRYNVVVHTCRRASEAGKYNYLILDSRRNILFLQKHGFSSDSDDLKNDEQVIAWMKEIKSDFDTNENASNKSEPGSKKDNGDMDKDPANRNDNSRDIDKNPIDLKDAEKFGFTTEEYLEVLRNQSNAKNSRGSINNKRSNVNTEKHRENEDSVKDKNKHTTETDFNDNADNEFKDVEEILRQKQLTLQETVTNHDLKNMPYNADFLTSNKTNNANVLSMSDKINNATTGVKYESFDGIKQDNTNTSKASTTASSGSFDTHQGETLDGKHLNLEKLQNPEWSYVVLDDYADREYAENTSEDTTEDSRYKSVRSDADSEQASAKQDGNGGGSGDGKEGGVGKGSVTMDKEGRTQKWSELEIEDFVNIAPAEADVEDVWAPPIPLTRGQSGVFDVDEMVTMLRHMNALDVAVIRMPEYSDFADYIVIATGKSHRHLNAMAADLKWTHKKKKNASDRYLKIEGAETDWLAMDLGNMLLHLFLQPTRELYDLETLWTLGPEYDPQCRQVEDPYSYTVDELPWLQELEEQKRAQLTSEVTSEPQKYNISIDGRPVVK